MPSELAMRIAGNIIKALVSDTAPHKKIEEDFAELVDKEIATLLAEIERLKLKNKSSLANNLCPDHRDKQGGKPCLACEIEMYEGMKDGVTMRIADLESDNAALRQQVAELRHLLSQCRTWVDDHVEAEECEGLMSDIDAALKEPSRDA